MPYATKQQIEYIYGAENIRSWADLDGTKNAEASSDRIDYILEQAEEFVNSRLVLGKYAIPFTSVPKLISHLTAMLAGVMLYDGRQVVSATNRDQVSRQRQDVHKLINKITAGQIRLIHPLSGEAIEPEAYNAPFITESQEEDTRPCQRC